MLRPHALPKDISAGQAITYLQNSNYQMARADYEKGLLELPDMARHATNTIRVGRAIENLRKAHVHLSEVQFQDLLGTRITPILMQMIEDGMLDLSPYLPKSAHKNGYAKYLLYSHAHPEHPYCLQLFAFAPKQHVDNMRGQRTKLHNHIAPCASSVLQGTLEETLYCPVQGPRKGAPLARQTSQRLRPTGSVDGFAEDEIDTVHRLENIGSEKAISVHFYREIDGIRIETPLAAKHRELSNAFSGKANVANFYRAVKPGKPADS
ncbi:MAG TPA: hypothetical protein VFV39_02910 [Limnobacter sp.]|nr:hypothetical protein [Limnobacter sp.]